jgi:K+-sensing histidine kinase KdpD
LLTAFNAQLSIFPTAALSSAILIVEPLRQVTAIMTSTQKPAALGKIPLLRRMHSLMGGAVCAVAALAAVALAAGHPWQVWVPLPFSVVLLLTAWFFGARAGILGTLLGAAIFAYLLFSPRGSIHVADATARANLGWMLLVGIGFSLLFAPSRPDDRRSQHRGETTEPSRRAS